MKRYGNLWKQMISFSSLLRAARKAQRGKRFRPDVARFHYRLEHELWKLHEELATKTYRPGAYRSFHVYEPKKRLISAAPYRDRVVHHAVTRILEPIFERSFISDSYACRKGKGTHAAVRRAQHYAHRLRRRVRRMQQQYARREIGPKDIRQRLMSWAGHARQADTYLVRRRRFATMTFRRAMADKPCVAGRVVQQ